MSTATESTDAPEGAWHREYADGWEFQVPGPGGGVLRVPYAATDPDRPLHEQLQRFADAIRILPDETRPRNIIEALARCIYEMPAIGKDQQMGSEGSAQAYKYRSIEAVTSHASQLFGRYCVVPKPHKIKRSVREVKMGSGSTVWTEDLIMVKYRLYGPGGSKDFITTGWFHALARDNSDKGTNKGMTQAYKQMLLQILVVGDNKDDPDTYSPAGGNQPEATKATFEDWLAGSGWPDDETRIEARKQVYDAIRRLRSAEDITREEANEWWRDYTHVNPEVENETARTKAEHDAWWHDHDLPAPEPEPESAPEPARDQDSREAAQSPPEPPADATAQPDPEPAPTAEAPTGPAPEPEQPTLADETAPEPARQPEPEPEPAVPEMPEDNGYRSAGDDILREAGPDELLGYLRALPIPDVVRELQHRGVTVVGEYLPQTLRRLLGGIIINRNAAAISTAQADTPAPPETADTPADQGKPAGRAPRSRRS